MAQIIKFSNRLSLKLARYSVLVALCLGLILSTIQVLYDLHQQESQISEKVQQIHIASLATAKRAVKTLDRDLAEEVIAGLLQYSYIQSAEIQDELKEVLAKSAKIEQPSSTLWLTQTIADQTKIYQWPLPTDMKEGETGLLTITVNIDHALKPFFERSFIVFSSGIVRNIILSLILFVIFYYMLTNPLENLSGQLSEFSNTNEYSKKVTIEPQNRNDELGTLVDVSNQFIDKVSKLLKDKSVATENLKQTEICLLNLIDQLPQLVTTVDYNGKIIFTNIGFKLFFNLNAELASNLVIRDIIGKNNTSLKRFNAAIEQLELSQSSVVVEDILLINDHNTPVQFSLHITPFSYCGNPTYLVVATDISESIKYQQKLINQETALFHSKEQLAKAQSIAKVGSWSVDLKDNSLSWSDQTYQIFGLDKQHNKADFNLLTDDVDSEDIENFSLHFLSSIYQFKAFDFIFKLNAQGQIKAYRATSEVEIDDNGQPTQYSGIIQDITLHYYQEKKLRQTQNMDALGKVISGVTHDFNNLLGIIIGYVELLQVNAYEDHDELLRYLSNIETAANRGASLARKLLSFSKHEQELPTPTDINALILSDQELLAKSLTTSIELDLHLGENLWKTNIDRNAFSDGLLNLCINAKHAMPLGGKIAISTCNLSCNAKFLDSSPLKLTAGDYVGLTVKDNGSGMTQDVLNRIFEPFFSTKGKAGSGLGLSQIYGFVHSSGGDILAKSKIDQGAEFSIYLPKIADDDAINDADSINCEPDNLTGSETILLVEDEPELLALAKEHLTNNGYKVITATNGLEGLTLFSKEPVDIVVSDILMPKLNGLQLVEAIKQLSPDMPIQLMSGYFDESELYSELSRTYFEQRLKKPINYQQLLEKIKILLQQRQTIS